MHPIVLWLFFSLFMMPIDELKKYKETDNIYKAEARRYWYEHKAK